MAIEFPEAAKIAAQMNTVLPGHTISRIEIRDPDSSVFRWGFVNLDKVDISGQTIDHTEQHGDDIYIYLASMVLRFGAMIGKLLYHRPEDKLPKKPQVTFLLEDGAAFTYNPSLYGWAQGFTPGQAEACKQAAGLSPLDPDFTPEYLAKAFSEPKRKIAKQMNVDFVKYKAAGVGNGYWHDILYLSGVHPQRKSADISDREFELLHGNTVKVIREAVEAGGSIYESDFFNSTGSYRRLLGKDSKGHPCLRCGSEIEVKNLLGSASYFCPGCQK